MKSAAVSWRRWALYGAVVAAVYTGLNTLADLETRSFALYAGKMVGSIIAGAILGYVAARVRNRSARRDGVAPQPDNPA